MLYDNNPDVTVIAGETGGSSKDQKVTAMVQKFNQDEGKSPQIGRYTLTYYNTSRIA